MSKQQKGPEVEDCQTGRSDICRAGKQDGIICPDDSCDIDDGSRKDPFKQQEGQAPTKELISWLLSEAQFWRIANPVAKKGEALSEKECAKKSGMLILAANALRGKGITISRKAADDLLHYMQKYSRLPELLTRINEEIRETRGAGGENK